MRIVILYDRSGPAIAAMLDHGRDNVPGISHIDHEGRPILVQRARFGITPDALAELVRARLPKP